VTLSLLLEHILQYFLSRGGKRGEAVQHIVDSWGIFCSFVSHLELQLNIELSGGKDWNMSDQLRINKEEKTFGSLVKRKIITSKKWNLLVKSQLRQECSRTSVEAEISEELPKGEGNKYMRY